MTKRTPKRTRPAPAHLATRDHTIEARCLRELMEKNGYILRSAPARDRYLTAFNSKTGGTCPVIGVMLWVPADSVLGIQMADCYRAMDAKAARLKRKSAQRQAKRRTR